MFGADIPLIVGEFEVEGICEGVGEVAVVEGCEGEFDGLGLADWSGAEGGGEGVVVVQEVLGEVGESGVGGGEEVGGGDEDLGFREVEEECGVGEVRERDGG